MARDRQISRAPVPLICTHICITKTQNVFMKNLFLISALVVLSLGSVSAQTSVAKNKKISEDEVPSNVLTAFRKDFPRAEQGTWTIYYNQSLAGSKISITPKWYSYAVKGSDGKAEAQYTPDGKLERSKGMGKDRGEQASDKAGSTKGSN